MEDERISSSIYSGFSLEQPSCPIILRILAYGIDLGIIVGIFYLVFIPGAIVAGFFGLAIASLKLSPFLKSIIFVALVVVLVLIALCISSWYFIRNELKYGATPGKKLFGLKVVSIDGNNLTFRQCLYRDALRIVDAMMILPGLLCMVLNRQNRRLGDLASGTMVIYLERDAKEDEFFYIKQDEYHMLCERLDPNIPELELCSEFLTYAFPAFIQNKRDRLRERNWEPRVRGHFKSDLGTKVDRETAMLFFAELCQQTSSQKKKKKSLDNVITVN